MPQPMPENIMHYADRSAFSELTLHTMELTKATFSTAQAECNIVTQQLSAKVTKQHCDTIAFCQGNQATLEYCTVT